MVESVELVPIKRIGLANIDAGQDNNIDFSEEKK
jgi:hypothetical protein